MKKYNIIKINIKRMIIGILLYILVGVYCFKMSEDKMSSGEKLQNYKQISCFALLLRHFTSQ